MKSTDSANVGEGPDAAALRALLEQSLLAGPEVIAEIISEEENSPATEDEKWRAELKVAQAEAVDNAQMQAIYENILLRAPEHKVQPSLHRVQAVLDLLGDPELAYPVIHLTGTNGKTSTARMLDSLLGRWGIRTGLFTSPHLESVRERIRLSGEPISAQAFIAAWEDVAPYIAMVDEREIAEGGSQLSFFEVFTVMALAAFADAPVDAAIIEVGMGGVWDATNVVSSQVQVIMPISRDHEQWLGAGLSAIATEKAGIIKPGGTVVIAEQPEEVVPILLEAAAAAGSTVRLWGRDIEVLSTQIAVGGQLVSIRTPAAIYEDIFVPLHGAHQAANAACALTAAEAFLGGGQMDPLVVEGGFQAATSPGRIEIVRASPTVVVDSAHNPAGAAALRLAVEDTFEFTRVIGIMAAMSDKDVEGILSELEPLLDSLVVTTLPTSRAMSVAELAQVATEVFGPDNVYEQDTISGAVEQATTLAESTGLPAGNTAVLVFGSVVLAGELRKLFKFGIN